MNKKGVRAKFQSKIVRRHLPSYFHKLVIESENKYYDNPDKKNLEYLLYLYKIGIEFLKCGYISDYRGADDK